MANFTGNMTFIEGWQFVKFKKLLVGGGKPEKWVVFGPLERGGEQREKQAVAVEGLKYKKRLRFFFRLKTICNKTYKLLLTDFKGKVAVITGAAGGFGLAMAHRFGREGMNLVLADIDEAGLGKALEEVKPYGGEAIAVTTDVGDMNSVQHLADITFDRFPVVHLLVNNAGISSVGPVWETRLEDWKHVFEINFFGIVHGLQAFLQRMMRQDFPSHIVNTASAAGLLAPPGLSIYTATKHAAVALSETLFADLRLVQSPVGVSVLCPAWVKTGIAGKQDPEAFARMSNFTKKAASAVMKALETSTVSVEEVAEATFQAVKKGEFYILTHPEVKEDFMKRANRINNGQVPYMDGLS